MMKAIKNSWKQSAEWVTALEDKVSDIFIFTRFRLTVLYFIVGFFLLVVSGLVIDSLVVSSIRETLVAALGNREVAEAAASAVIEKELQLMWLTRMGMLLVAAIVAYILAGITLGPIRQAFESQRHFVANASHELRTPLAIMRTTSEVTLMDRDLSQKDALKTVKNNLEEIKRMADTLQVLLNFSGYNRAEKLRFSTVNLYDVVSKVVRLVKPAADAKNIRLTFFGHNPSVVEGNMTALEEMTLNLVKNAVTYTPKRGLVNIDVASESNNGILLSIKDTGIGISEEDMPHIFDPFYRGTNYSLVKEPGNTGLGLAIVKEIASLHRAKIEVKSEPNMGTAFFVRFAAAKK